MLQLDIQDDGHAILRDGNWRGVVDPHKTKILDTIGVDLTAAQRQAVMDKWATIPVKEPEPVGPPPPTNDEIYDRAIQANKVLKAIMLSIDDGSFVFGAKVGRTRLKAIVTANM